VLDLFKVGGMMRIVGQAYNHTAYVAFEVPGANPGVPGDPGPGDPGDPGGTPPEPPPRRPPIGDLPNPNFAPSASGIEIDSAVYDDTNGYIEVTVNTV
jgi:hypothetical protein